MFWHSITWKSKEIRQELEVIGAEGTMANKPNYHQQKKPLHRTIAAKRENLGLNV